MQLGVALLVCVLVLCVTRAALSQLNALEFSAKSVALCALLVLVGNAFVFTIVVEFVINPGAMLLCVLLAVVTARRYGSARMLLAVVCAIGSALLMTLLKRSLITGHVLLFEPGLFMALAGMPFLFFLRGSGAPALFCAALAPLLASIMEVGLDLRAYGYAVLELGGTTAFDAQICGIIFATGIVWVMRTVQLRRAQNA